MGYHSQGKHCRTHVYRDICDVCVHRVLQQKDVMCLRNIMYKSTFEVVAVWLRLSSFLNMTFFSNQKADLLCRLLEMM